MRLRKLIVAVLALALSSSAWGQRRGFRWPARASENASLARNEAEKKVLAALEQAQRSGDTYLNVSSGDGRLLRVLAETAGAKTVVEIGTSTGLSGLWLSLALLSTGGRLTTFELDSGRAATARAAFKKADVDHLITVIEGDAHRNVTRLSAPVDVVFIDADKEGYLDYLNKLLPLVRPGGLILAHNVQSAGDYVRAVTSRPELETVFAGDGEGLGITLKKR
jgi:caffeoyl-CoA O-methyltransferase